jgi:hypothetical protein
MRFIPNNLMEKIPPNDFIILIILFCGVWSAFFHSGQKEAQSPAKVF